MMRRDAKGLLDQALRYASQPALDFFIDANKK